ncbi:MAG: hypothetical protein IH624_00355 [Phycisphaerae bacterium]|nr:hypothetical protein [Phycisphaerae bacterium]
MRRKANNEAEETPAGAPEWMVTFSDCMTLLLTFFVLLLSFAAFRPRTLEGLGSSFAQALPTVGMSFTDKREAVLERPQIEKTERLDKGADTPTLTPEDRNNFMKERRPLDFRNLKVFTIPSSDFFFGRGEVISQQGRTVLDKLAILLLADRTRVVISENGPDGNPEMGLQRAWAVAAYLAGKEGLNKNMFSITASCTLRQRRGDQRMLEITLLERDIYE